MVFAHDTEAALLAAVALVNSAEPPDTMTTPAQLDAFYVAQNMAVRESNGEVKIVPATPEKEREAEFIMLRDGLIVFEGDADALRGSKDPYIREFLS